MKIKKLLPWFLVLVISGCGFGDDGKTSNQGGGGSGGNGEDSDTRQPTGKTYQVGGFVIGLKGAGLIVSLESGDDLHIDKNGAFVFQTQKPDLAVFRVSVTTQPTLPTQMCSVANGIGVVDAADVTDVTITCQDAYFIGGNVSGLRGSVSLLSQSGEIVKVAKSGSFRFGKAVLSGSHFGVTIFAQPDLPLQECQVANGKGVVETKDITEIQVTCLDFYPVGGTVNGLAGEGLRLRLKSLTDGKFKYLDVSKTQSFVFEPGLLNGSAYEIGVANQPSAPNQTCTVENDVDTGVINSAPVDNITVRCVDTLYSIGGSISGLVGHGLVLLNNQGDALTVSRGSTQFQFPTFVRDGSPYSITIQTQPSYLHQTCSIQPDTAAGSINGANVSTVMIQCVTESYNVSGTVSGLVAAGGGLVLQSATGEQLPIADNGQFTFTQSFLNGSFYGVFVKSQPESIGQICKVIRPDDGVINGANVTALAVQCEVLPVRLLGMAQFHDMNENNAVDLGDQLVMSFSRPVETSAGASAGDFSLAVTNDYLGAGAILEAGDLGNQVRITLGVGPVLNIKGDFNTNILDAGSPSGIDVATTIQPDAIQDPVSGRDAEAVKMVDLVPAFRPTANLSGNHNTKAVVSADLDGDGDADLVVAYGYEIDSQSGEQVAVPARVLLMDETGTLVDTNQQLLGGDTRALVLGDIDGDDDRDLIVVNYGQSDRVFLNDGNGVFTDTLQTIGYQFSSTAVLGDVDGDKDLDLVVGGTGGTRLFLNDGMGLFSELAQSWPVNDIKGLALADVDLDDDLDLIVAGSDKDLVMLNNGSGDFNTVGGLKLTYGQATSIVVGDVNRDGKVDLVFGYANQNITIYTNGFNNGKYIFVPNSLDAWEGGTRASVLVDVDGDSDLDLVVGNYARASRIYINNGNGYFADSGQELPGSTTAIAAFRDGKGLALILANDQLETDTLYRVLPLQ